MISLPPRWPTRGAPRPRLNEAGFTLLELLVVVIIVGILATVVIPRFARSRERTYDAAAKSDLRNAMSAQEAYFADYQSYTTDAGAAGFEPSPAVTITIPSADGLGYVMTAKHGSSANTYCINSDIGEIVTGTTC